MADTHHQAEDGAGVGFALRCPCGNPVNCTAPTTDREASDLIDMWLDSKIEVRCDACRAMPR